MFYKYNKHRKKEVQEKRQLSYLQQSTTLKEMFSISENKQLLVQFFEFMKRISTSEKYQNNNLKALIAYSKSLEPTISFYEIKDKSQIKQKRL